MRIIWKIPVIEQSPWPIIITINLLSIAMNVIEKLHSTMNTIIINSLSIRIGIGIITIIYWFYDFFLESFKGFHTSLVNKSIYIGLILFIISEGIIFISLFFTYFYNSLLPDPTIGCLWLPFGIEAIDFISIPLLNTILLITSGFTITIEHNQFHSLKNRYITIWFLITIILGIIFSILQGIEYKLSFFTFTDSIFGSTFYTLTGFHGLHVIIGLIFILITWLIFIPSLFSSSNSKFLLFSSFYWHFVDLIWLFLFFSLYFLPSL